LPEGHPPIDTAAAIKVLGAEAERNPEDPKPPLNLANFLYDQHQYSEAVIWYQKALALDPGNVNARTDLGTCYFNLGRPKEAIREFQESLKKDPRHQPTWYNLIVVNLDGTHDLAAARTAWEKLHSLNPNYEGLEELRKTLDESK
jgi:tetratricopeptide (TPR) repeat protein